MQSYGIIGSQRNVREMQWLHILLTAPEPMFQGINTYGSRFRISKTLNYNT